MVSIFIAAIISVICFIFGWGIGRSLEINKRLDLVNRLLKETKNDEETKIIIKFNYLA